MATYNNEKIMLVEMRKNEGILVDTYHMCTYLGHRIAVFKEDGKVYDAFLDQELNYSIRLDNNCPDLKNVKMGEEYAIESYLNNKLYKEEYSKSELIDFVIENEELYFIDREKIIAQQSHLYRLVKSLIR